MIRKASTVNKNDINKWKKYLIGSVVSVIVGIFLNLICTNIIFNKNSGYCGYAVWIFACLILYILFSFRNVAIKRMEIIFSITALLMGTFFIVISPATVGVSWDDQIHYGRTVTLIDYLGGKYSKADEDEISNTAAISGTFSDETHSGLTREKRKQLSNKLNQENSSNEEGTNMIKSEGFYSIAYIPSFIGLLIGRLLHLSWVACFNTGRFCNLLSYVTVISFAISRLKEGRLACAMTGMIPTSIFMASSYSYDPWVISWSILGFAELYRMISEPEVKISTKKWCKMLFVFLIAFMPKMVYVVALFPLLFVSSDRFENRKTAIMMKIAVFIIAIILAVLAVTPEIIRGTLSTGDIRGGEGVNPAGQIKYILGHPLSASITIWHFFIDYAGLSNGAYVQFFAYLSGGRFEVLTFVLLFVAAFTEEDQYDRKMSGKFKIIGIVGIIFAILAVILALYIMYNPVGIGSVGGVQQRYIFPLIFPFLYYIRPASLVVKWKSEKYAVVPMALVVLMFIYNIYTNVVIYY